MKMSRGRSFVIVTIVSLLSASGILALLVNLTLNGEYLLPRPKPVSANAPVDLPGGIGSDFSNVDHLLGERNIKSSFNASPGVQDASNSTTEPAISGLADELLEVTRGYRLINTLHLDEIKSQFDQIENTEIGLASVDNFDDPDRVEQAMVQAWNVNYPNISTFDQMLMPLELTDLQNASQFSIDLLTHPFRLDSSAPEIIQLFNPQDLEGKNWLEIVFNTHGFDMPFGEDAVLGVEQPIWGALHYTYLSFYAVPGSFDEQIAFIPISDLYRGGGPLNLDSPTGSLRIRIQIDQGHGVDIARVAAFYLTP